MTRIEGPFSPSQKIEKMYISWWQLQPFRTDCISCGTSDIGKKTRKFCNNAFFYSSVYTVKLASLFQNGHSHLFWQPSFLLTYT